MSYSIHSPSTVTTKLKNRKDSNVLCLITTPLPPNVLCLITTPLPRLITPSLEARYPLLAAAAETTTLPPQPLPQTREGLSVSRRGVLVTAFGEISNTGKRQLRLWELAGESGTLTVKLPKGMKVSRMTPVNLRGEPTGKSERIWFGRFSVELKAFAPASFVLE